MAPERLRALAVVESLNSFDFLWALRILGNPNLKSDLNKNSSFSKSEISPNVFKDKRVFKTGLPEI